MSIAYEQLLSCTSVDEDVFEEPDVSVERSVELPASPQEVWRRITDGELLSEWMGGEVTITPRAGQRINLAPEAGPLVWGTVEEVVEGRRIQWSWRTDDTLPTLVELEISAGESGTTLTVRETLLPWTISGPGPQNHLQRTHRRPGFRAAA